jgi:hypothetical protein
VKRLFPSETGNKIVKKREKEEVSKAREKRYFVT